MSPEAIPAATPISRQIRAESAARVAVCREISEWGCHGASNLCRA